MSYVFDNGPLSMLFKNYFRSVFPTLWDNFDELIANGEIVSVREIAREIADSSIEVLRTWVADNGEVFAVPSPQEAAFITQIYSVKHFQYNIEQQKLLKGGRMADPFVIAKAHTEGRTVVTTEVFKPNGTKIPNICRHFGVKCMSIQEFMEEQNWRF
ncbi:PIN domain-containing protein [Methylobacterium sp. WSM2598]|uniref:PIN domain-containing protein n=1 Tax=Methylobacterium sp. WSM2598 TaxID=398261 RepID=UPI000A03D165|nr:PIN domain-containing protein [Methylobacterium sp. WSM2598]